MAKRNRERRTTLSNRYQYKFNEIPFSDAELDSFSSVDSISGRLNPWKYNEEVLNLKDRLAEKLIVIAKNIFTEKQWQVFDLYILQDWTQKDIAELQGVHQSTITKSMIGNPGLNYKKDMYGGSFKKLRRAAMQDSECCAILNRITDLEELIY